MKTFIFSVLIVSSFTSFAGVTKCVSETGMVVYTDGICMTTGATMTPVRFLDTNTMNAFKAPTKPNPDRRVYLNSSYSGQKYSVANDVAKAFRK